MNKLEKLLSNVEDENPWILFEKDYDKSERMGLVKAASKEQLEKLILHFDDHQVFNFLELFIGDGKCENMTSDEYDDFLEKSGLY